MSLLFILFFPLVIGAILLVAKPKQAFAISLIASIIELVATLLVLKDAAAAENGLVFTKPWIEEAGISFSLWVDGVNGILIALCALMVPFIVATTANSDKANNSQYQGLMLAMQTALMGAFLAKDAFLFYFFFEASLLPIYFLAAIYGGENKNAITFKFFVYTLFGSLFLLIGLIYVYLVTPGSHSSDIETLYQTAIMLPEHIQGNLFLAFFIAFAIKMPIFPFHTWQPDTYTVAPTQATMLLSGIMLKMGTYGLIRLVLPMFPLGIITWGNTAVILSVIGIIYGSIIAIQQKDAKRLLAYSSFAHVGLMSAGILSQSLEGIQGALYQMLSHGINIVGLFFIIEIIERRTKSREIAQLGGITQYSYVLTVAFVILSLGSVALPLTNGFIGEFLLLKSVFDYDMILGIVAGITIILGAVYTLRLIQKTMFGNFSRITKDFEDLSAAEKWVLIPLCALVLAGGVYPTWILNFTEPGVQALVSLLK
ncbi:complex I subunit 4 family protein [Aquirufa ecclesiirivi]|uniref:complex I subunit 4 family protein n=1 Tax=Aquirufa ecclesiirivi TaxID=2715124 RepID=UPI001407B5D1|nr:NADH-quinone oxidoreductase subunit M [Aquirufa ecclesiirivi]NHC48300.1 NADH-quinone oxidoreductase subunit M [Aquirufa ecclesiirivi]